MSAWAFLVGNFARTPGELRVFDEALHEIVYAERRRCAARQKAFFNNLYAQGADGNWYYVSDWLTRPLADQEEEENDAA